MKLLDYIRGFRSGKEAHQLEKESMRDPFLADAMDGYQQTEGNHEQQLDILYRKVAARSMRKRSSLFVWGVAASLLIGVFIGGYFLVRNDELKKEQLLVQGTAPAPFIEQNETREPVTNSKTDSATVKTVCTPEPPIKKQQKKKIKSSHNTVSPRKTILHKETDQAAGKEVPVEAVLCENVQDSGCQDVKSIVDSMNIQMIRGTVIDQKGEPLVGASISLKGSMDGTISDINGHFALRTNGKKDLSVSYIGYEPVSLKVDTADNLLIAMNENQSKLSETVVVGFATLKKVDTALSASVPSLVMPRPIIGQELYEKYLRENIIRPVDDAGIQIKGVVVLQFYINKKGQPINITVKQSLCDPADREAIRLIREGPDWIFGDKAVEVKVNF